MQTATFISISTFRMPVFAEFSFPISYSSEFSEVAIDGRIVRAVPEIILRGPQALFCPVGGGCFVDNVSEGWGG